MRPCVHRLGVGGFVVIRLAASHSIARWAEAFPDHPNCIYQPWRDGYMAGGGYQHRPRPNEPSELDLYEEGFEVGRTGSGFVVMAGG